MDCGLVAVAALASTSASALALALEASLAENKDKSVDEASESFAPIPRSPLAGCDFVMEERDTLRQVVAAAGIVMMMEDRMEREHPH